MSAAPAPPGVAELQALLDGHQFSAIFGFQVLGVGGGAATLRVPFHERWVRPGGIVSGPVLMAAADCAMWMAVIGNLGGGTLALTTQLDTAFIGAARREDVTCTARILRAGSRLIYGSADCYGADGRQLTHHLVTYARERS